jgi:ribosomal protein S18 acetylase RimI-like enzyme
VVSETPIEIALYEQVPGVLGSQAQALARTVFRLPDETPAQRAERHDRFCSQDDRIRRILATRGKEVVGYATAYRRVIEYPAAPKGSIVLGGIGDVCVVPDYRRRGIATDLALAAIWALDVAGCDVAYLCAEVELPHIVKLYGRARFVVLGRPHTYLGASGRRYVDHDAMIAPIGSHAIFEQILHDAAPFDIGRGNW